MSEPISYREEIKRKLIHLSSLWMVVAITLLPAGFLSPALFGTLFVLTLLIERAFVLKLPIITPVYRFFFGKMLRHEPAPGDWIVSGGAPVYAAAALSTLMFSSVAAASGMAVLLTADAAAALIGRRFGRHKTVNHKSLEGFLAFIITGCAALALYFICLDAAPLLYAFIPAAVIPAALAELFQKQLRVDDNFSIPLVTGAVIQLGVFLVY